MVSIFGASDGRRLQTLTLLSFLLCVATADPGLCHLETTQNGCFNNPSNCYWCDEGQCMSQETLDSLFTVSCTQDTCRAMTSAGSVSCLSSSSNCGWCTTMQSGYKDSCQFSAMGEMPVGSCASGWSINPPCGVHTSEDTCFNNPVECAWCPSSDEVTNTTTAATTTTAGNVTTTSAPGNSTNSSGNNQTVANATSNVTVAPRGTCVALVNASNQTCSFSPQCQFFNGSSTSCLTLPSYCGWCGIPVNRTTFNCQYASAPNFTMPQTCLGNWTVGNASDRCEAQVGIERCYSATFQCFWCGATGTCSSKNITGGTCSVAGVMCARFTTQATCLSASKFCGWCSRNRTCLYSVTGGSPTGLCDVASWSSQPRCEHQMTMDMCLNTVYNCAWCNSNRTCQAKGSSQCTTGVPCSRFGGSSVVCRRYSTYCGWCAAPVNVSFSSCQFSSTANIPVRSCAANWTSAITCSGKNRTSCLAGADGSACYWCSHYGPYSESGACTMDITLAVYSKSECWRSDRCDQATTRAECLNLELCGYCGGNTAGGAPRCQFTSSGVAPMAAASCTSGWESVAMRTCDAETSRMGCWNNVRQCLFCGDVGTCRTDSPDGMICSKSPCSGSTSFSCKLGTTTDQGACGWCATPQVGISSTCQFSNSSQAQPPTCASGWSPNADETISLDFSGFVLVIVILIILVPTLCCCGLIAACIMCCVYRGRRPTVTASATSPVHHFGADDDDIPMGEPLGTTRRVSSSPAAAAAGSSDAPIVGTVFVPGDGRMLPVGAVITYTYPSATYLQESDRAPTSPTVMPTSDTEPTYTPANGTVSTPQEFPSSMD